MIRAAILILTCAALTGCAGHAEWWQANQWAVQAVHQQRAVQAVRHTECFVAGSIISCQSR